MNTVKIQQAAIKSIDELRNNKENKFAWAELEDVYALTIDRVVMHFIPKDDFYINPALCGNNPVTGIAKDFYTMDAGECAKTSILKQHIDNKGKLITLAEFVNNDYESIYVVEKLLTDFKNCEFKYSKNVLFAYENGKRVAAICCYNL